MRQILERKLKAEILVNPRWRAFVATSAARINRSAYRFARLSRRLVRFMNHHVTSDESDRFVYRQPELHKRIEDVLKRQRKEYPHYSYFYGQPYQALGILGVFGERSTEERFDDYQIRDKIGPEDRLLDIGCNCGFMCLYTAFRTGCRGHGIDINPYMVEVGGLCAEYLNLTDKVKLEAIDIHEFAESEAYSVVFSFATHWTDDENYQVPYRQHFEQLNGYLKTGGLLVFESHANDVGNKEFYTAIEQASDLFDCELRKDTDNSTRHLYHLRKR